MEYRVYGPPGTGKTRYLTDKALTGVRMFGAPKVMISSYTKAAAAEIAARAVGVPEKNIGTLHSFAMRSIGYSGEPADEMKKDFGVKYPQLRFSGINCPEGWGDTQGNGDFYLGLMNSYRSRMIPKERWPVRRVAEFSDRWEEWKKEAGLIDYTDMLEMALKEVPEAPGSPRVGYFDESQDLSPLAMALVRKWGEKMEYFIVVGDPDQCIYQFAGAEPEAFYATELPEDRIKVLAQSYRVPRAVHKWAVDWIEQSPGRQKVDYLPTGVEGEAKKCGEIRYPHPVALLRHADKYLEAGKRIMILASCAYMLAPLISELREAGIPFWNPYAKDRYNFNPLHAGKGTPSIKRLAAFLNGPPWGSQDAVAWLKVMRKKGTGIYPGALNIAEQMQGPFSVPQLFDPESEDAQVFAWDTEEERVKWMGEHLLSTAVQGMAYPIRVYKAGGRQAVVQSPQITVGTIHSVKGGEADVVYLFPDLSIAGGREWGSRGRGRESVRRLYYVGATRAKETLILCGASSAGTEKVWP